MGRCTLVSAGFFYLHERISRESNPQPLDDVSTATPVSVSSVCLQVEIADCMQTLFRGNSLASKIMAYCFKIYGHGYLRELLNVLVTDMFYAAEKHCLSYEVDPARCVLLPSC